MEFFAFVSILLTNGIDLKSSVAKKLFGEFQPFFIQPMSTPSSIADPYAIITLRANLTGSTIHEELVKVALNNGLVIDNLQTGRKIQAIKELRDATRCGLKEAKDAVEDYRVSAYYNPQSF